MSIQKVTESNMADYALGIKLRDISAEATKGTTYEPKPIQSAVTKEMLQQYQDEQNKPIIIDGRLYKYHPATTTVDLVSVDPASLEHVLSEDEIQQARLTLQQIAHEYQLSRQEIADLENQKQLNIDEINQPNMVHKFKPALTKAGKPKTKQAPDYNAEKAKIDAFYARRQELITANINIDNRITSVKDGIDNLNRESNEVQQKLDENEAKKQANQKVEMDIKQENERLIKKQEENIIALNSGKLSVERQPAETEQDYLDRLNKIGTEPDASLELQAEYKNTEDFKTMLRQITKSESTIENVLKMIPSTESRYMTLKNQKIIVDQIIKRFGAFNPRINENDIYQIMDKILTGIYTPPAPPATSAKPARSKYVNISRRRGPGRPKIPRGERSEVPRNPVGRPPAPIPEPIEGEVAEKKRPGRPRKIKLTGTGIESDTELGIEHLKKGFTQKEVPKYIQLGSVIILLKKLYYKNILAVKDLHMMNIKGFSNKPVSESMVEIIMKLCSDEMPNKNLINNLSTSEKHIFNTLIHIANLHKEVEHSKEITINHLKDRINLIEGEIQSGNNNPELLHELQIILYKLVHFNLLSAHQAKKHIAQYKNYHLNS